MHVQNPTRVARHDAGRKFGHHSSETNPVDFSALEKIGKSVGIVVNLGACNFDVKPLLTGGGGSRRVSNWGNDDRRVNRIDSLKPCGQQCRHV